MSAEVIVSAIGSAMKGEQDGRIYDGEVVERPENRNKKRAARLHSNLPPKKINLLDRDMNIFEISVPLPPREEIRFHLVYQHLMRRRNAEYKHVIVLDPRQIIRDFMAHVTVEESRVLSKFEVPPLRHNVTETTSNFYGEVNPEVSVHKVTGRHSEVTYRPSIKDQAMFSSMGIHAQFIVKYDLVRELAAADFQFGDGYFVQYIAPSTLAPIPKNILFILDSSGTMGGPKLEHTKDAMSTILSDLRRNDRFNIISYSTWLQIWHVDGLASATATNIQRAKSFINNMRADGGANMNDALLRGVNLLRMEIAKQDPRATRTSVIFLLTDGQATSGITSTERILSGMRDANHEHPKISVFALGLGQGVDWEFLQKVSLQNNGWARRVYDAPDTALQIQECFDEISTPVLLNVRARYGDSNYIPGSLTTAVYPAYYDGSELVVSGQLASNRRSNFVSRIASIAVTSPMELTASGNSRRNMLRRGDFPRFVERFWAYLNIKRLEDTILSTTDSTDHILAGGRIVELAQRYGWMTPLTAMEITKPGGVGRDTVTLRQPGSEKNTLQIKKKRVKQKRKDSHHENERLKPKRRPSSAGRRRTPFVDNDPHFMVMIDGISDGICFDIDGRLGDVFQLIYDPVSDITVNGLVVGKLPMTDKIKRMRTYFGKLAILTPYLNMTVNPHKVKYMEKNRFGDNVERVIHWNNTYLRAPNSVINITNNRELTVTLDEGIIVSILRHKVKKHHPYKVDYLGLYITDGTGFSLQTKGLIGQFQHQSASFSKGPTLNSNDTYKAEILLKGPFGDTRSIKAHLRRRKNMELQEHIACWHTTKNATETLAGEPDGYLVSRLYSKGHSETSIPHYTIDNDVT